MRVEVYQVDAADASLLPDDLPDSPDLFAAPNFILMPSDVRRVIAVKELSEQVRLFAHQVQGRAMPTSVYVAEVVSDDMLDRCGVFVARVGQPAPDLFLGPPEFLGVVCVYGVMLGHWAYRRIPIKGGDTQPLLKTLREENILAFNACRYSDDALAEAVKKQLVALRQS